ncbi:MAG: cation diffusion facilitator family transporter, partial [Acidimicrobiales bacterium]
MPDRGPHGHGGHATAHDHHRGNGRWWRPLAFLARLGHHRHAGAAERVDDALDGSAQGIRALKVSLVGLGATAALQAVVVSFTGSVALLSDTLHNLGDALTALPLWFAFTLGRRPRTRRFTYGYGRAEDVATIIIVAAIAASAALAGYESLRRMADPRPVRYLAAVMAAALVGAA